MANQSDQSQLALMAAVNDVIHGLHGSLGLPDSDFFCECAHVGCKERITLTRADFARLRDASHPVIVTAHAHRLVSGEVVELRS